jgi:hypothetical protein
MNMFLLRLQYKIKFYWGNFMEFTGYCRYCGMKMSITGKGRKICTNISCRKS